MTSVQGDLALLQTPVAQELLTTRSLARLSYVWTDGTPRIVPIWFGWNGTQVVMSSPADCPKLHAITNGTPLALSIDTDTPPYRVLLLRGPATVEFVEGVVPEYAAAARQQFGDEAGAAWVETAEKLSPRAARIALTPTWVGLLDFETRLPSAIERALEKV